MDDLFLRRDLGPILPEKIKSPSGGNLDADFLEDPHHGLMDMSHIRFAQRPIEATIQPSQLSPFEHLRPSRILDCVR